MFLSRFLSRRDARSIHRTQPRRRPLVEDLEGRRLLSTLTVANPESSVIVGQHIGVAAIQGAHIGTSAAIVGQYIG